MYELDVMLKLLRANGRAWSSKNDELLFESSAK